MWLWAVSGLAQLQSFHPPGHNEITYSINVPEITAQSGSGSIYIQMNSTRQVRWFALGQGTRMEGANMFVAYTSGDSVTVSPRSGIAEVEPLYNKDAQITMLDGSGVHDGVITANIRCDTCLEWSGGTEDVNSASSPWLWAVQFGDSLGSTSVSETITQHDDRGVVSIDMQKARGGSSENPFGQVTQPSVSSAHPSSDTFLGMLNQKQTAHAVLMILAFVILFPSFALGLHLFPARWTVILHGLSQLFTLAIAIAGLGVGVSMARDLSLIDNYHPIIGMVVVACLVVFQPAMGVLQHRFFRKSGRKGPFAYMHRWFGRLLIILGIINAGLGFKIARGPRGAVIATSVVAGVMGVVYVAVVWLGHRPRR